MLKSEQENYFVWLLGNGWFDCSLTMQLMFMQPESKEEVKRYIELAKAQYPSAFKKATE